MWNKAAAALLLAWVLFPGPALAADEEGCLFCHRLELHHASAAEGGSMRVSDPRGGPHESLYCSDCHADAKAAPHISLPGPSQCIGECHSATQGKAESHRTAAFGGLTEAHRKVAAPRSPCLLCHKASDGPGDLSAIDARCGACHAGERSSVAAGIHGRIRKEGEGVICAGCHIAHPASAKANQGGSDKAACAGSECHTRVTEGMKRVGGHGRGNAAGRSADRYAEAGLFLAIAAIGAASGRILRGGGGRRRGNG